MKKNMIMLQKFKGTGFSALPEWACERLDEADPETLEGWDLKVLESRKLEDVFG